MLVDIFIVIFLVCAAFRGHEIGLIRQVLSAVGFIGGLFIGAGLQPYLIPETGSEAEKALLSLALTLFSAVFFLSLSEIVGMRLKRSLRPIMRLDKADSIGGSVAGSASILIAVWLLSPSLANLPASSLKQSLAESKIVGKVNEALPSAPRFIASIDKVINPNGFPDVFGGLERTPLDDGTPLPELGELTTAIERVRPSVVKLEGRGCGGIVEGSGYVARKDSEGGVVVTNAHVIAGVARPTVIDANGRHAATAIWFDTNLDMAVLRVDGRVDDREDGQRDGLAGSPLSSGAAQLPAGTASAVLGYPGGGSFRANASTILDQFTANGRDIYDQNRTNRNIYELKADIIPGNSGGPLIDAKGDVIGLIFAESTTYDQIGYALTMGPVNDGLEQALQRNQPSGTGTCAE